MITQPESGQMKSFEEFLAAYYPERPKASPDVSSPVGLGALLARESLHRNLRSLRSECGGMESSGEPTP